MVLMLVCLHDFTSPASAVTVLRLQRLADEGVAIAFEGFVPLEFGLARPVPLDILAERDRALDAAAALGLALGRPSRLVPTMRAHAIAAVADLRDLGASWRLRCYRAFWEQDRDLHNEQVLMSLGVEAGLERDDVEQALSDPGVTQRLRRSMGRRRSQGAGGVPLLDASGTLVSPHLSDDDVRALAAL